MFHTIPMMCKASLLEYFQPVTLRNQLRASRSGIQKTKKEKKNNTKSTKRKQKL
jgi:hypothetical protein